MNLNSQLKTFSERLETARTNHKPPLSKRELADKIHVQPQTVIHWTNGKSFPRADRLLALSRFLGKPMEWFLGENISGQIRYHESAGIKWRVVKPEFSDPEKHKKTAKEIENGIRLFELIVKEKWDYPKIRATKEFAGSQEVELKRLLTALLSSRIIEIFHVDRNKELEDDLQNILGIETLQHCIVAKTNGLPFGSLINDTVRLEAVAFLAADEPIEKLRPGNKIGLGGGTTMSRFVDLVPPWPTLSGITWVPLLATKGTLTSNTYSYSENNVVARLLAKQPAVDGLMLPFLVYKNRYMAREEKSVANKDENEILTHAHWVLEQSRNVNTAFISVGHDEFGFRETDSFEGHQEIKAILEQMPKKTKDRYVGTILLRFVDEVGEEIGSKADKEALDRQMYSIELDELKNISARGLVWILAANPKKATIIKAALTAKRANGLIIDSAVAVNLLKLIKKDN